MGDVKILFQQNCECRYVPGMFAELNFADKQRNVSTDFIDRVLASGDVTKTDFFYLRAVTFYRIASAEMVAEYMRYFRSYYGAIECTNLLQPKVPNVNEDPLVRREDVRKSVAEIRGRLTRLAKKYLLFSHTIGNEGKEEGFGDLVFCASYTTFSLVRTFFGETPCFGDGTIGYERYYCVTPIQKMMETMHACRVGVLSFQNHSSKVRLLREKEMIFGSKKESYTPTMTAEVKCGDYDYKVIIEPIHFTVDDKILTATEHQQNIEALIATMGKLVSHYSYMERNFQAKPIRERIRFLIAVENLSGMKQIVQLMNEYRDKYSGKVFFTTDTALKGVQSLEESVLMAKEVPSKVSGEMHLGLVRPTRESLISTQNEWIFSTIE